MAWSYIPQLQMYTRLHNLPIPRFTSRVVWPLSDMFDRAHAEDNEIIMMGDINLDFLKPEEVNKCWIGHIPAVSTNWWIRGLVMSVYVI